MRIVVAGATGAVGRQLLPRLVDAGHEVVGLVRRPERSEVVRRLGGRAVVSDLLDAEAVAAAVAAAEPEAIVHMATALAGGVDPRHFDRDFAATNRLRTEGTDHLLAAGRAVGVRRVVAQSYAGWPYARIGGVVKREEDPLDPDPPAPFAATLTAIRHLEDAVTGASWTEGVVLRFGALYGPGTSLATDPRGEHAELIRRRRFPVVGDGAGVWSFLHVEDAASATVAALTHGERGVYNIVDDDPAPVADWLPQIARAVGGKPPRHVPRWIGRLAAGEGGAVMMTEVRGASNAKARQELGWSPRHPSWRSAFAGPPA
jgi:nucleoside-diphosphate-sugar epimerase